LGARHIPQPAPSWHDAWVIRVLVVDDHPVVRAGLESVLRSEPGMLCVGVCVGPHDAIALVRRARPDVALVDARLGDHDGLELCRAILREPAPPSVLIITADFDAAVVASARAAGARGAVDKATDLPELYDAIRLAARPIPMP
jgi:DNA-binding NarL/FixJ family response regulator